MCGETATITDVRIIEHCRFVTRRDMVQSGRLGGELLKIGYHMTMLLAKHAVFVVVDKFSNPLCLNRVQV